jgi:thermitase
MIPKDAKWPWEGLEAARAWACVKRNRQPVVVAVIDSGVADNHADLQQYLLPALTVIGETRDDDDHGTLIAGTIVGASLGVDASDKLRIRSVKFCSEQVLPDPNCGARAIELALDADPRADVIVLAWDVGYNTPALQQAIDRAGREDVIVVTAAGNESLDNDLYTNWPANYGKCDHVITVMATDKENERASFSSYGAETVYLAAPGVDVLSTAPYVGEPSSGSSVPIGYRRYPGSSAAAAHVASLIALLRLQNPKWTAKQIKDHLGATAIPKPGLGRYCKTGRIANFARAVCD